MSQVLNKQHPFWYNHICNANQSGKSSAAYAKEHGLNLKTLYNRKMLFRNFASAVKWTVKPVEYHRLNLKDCIINKLNPVMSHD